MEIKNIRNCARCGGSHRLLVAKKLEQPFAPPEAAPIVWTHWTMCPTNHEPVMVRVEGE